jgi:hypothetical protein
MTADSTSSAASRKNAQGHANIYPVGSDQFEPDLFWDGLEFFCEGPLCPTW